MNLVNRTENLSRTVALAAIGIIPFFGIIALALIFQPASWAVSGETLMGKADAPCGRPENHPRHMCQLFKMGMMMEIDQRSAKPTVSCAKCGAKADAPEFVCQPKSL